MTFEEKLITIVVIAALLLVFSPMILLAIGAL